MDALDLGWGSHLEPLKMPGFWSTQNLSLHINIRTLQVIQLACPAFLPHIRGRGMVTNNTTVMFYVNKQGAQSSLFCQEAILLWDVCIGNSILLKVDDFTGAQNMLADLLSRWFISHHMWSDCPDITKSIFKLWGTSQMDLFATKDNRKYHQFCSWADHSPGSLTEAFLLLWSEGVLYTFPTILPLPRVLCKVKEYKAHLILSAPAKSHQHWFSQLLNLSTSPPLSLPLHTDLISQNHGHLLNPSLQAFHVMA